MVFSCLLIYASGCPVAVSQLGIDINKFLAIFALRVARNYSTLVSYAPTITDVSSYRNLWTSALISASYFDSNSFYAALK